MYVPQQPNATPETGLLSQIIDWALGGPEKRARAQAKLEDAKAAAMKREALEQEMAWMQQMATQKGLQQAAEAQVYLQDQRHQHELALEDRRQQGQTKLLVGVGIAGLIGFTLWRRWREEN